MTIICHQHERVGKWVADACFFDWHPGQGVAMGFENSEGQLVAGCIFEQYNGTHMFLHAASIKGTYFPRDFLHACFHFCFISNQCTRISCIVDSSNHKCQKFVAGVGWKEETRLKGAGIKGGDLIVYMMIPKDCKWLSEDEKNGRQF